jgi:hypothetical protein
MKPGDLVRVEGRMINSGTWVMESLGIFLGNIPWNHPSYSPSFPSCEILTRQGVKLIGLERIRCV